jgi:GDPmannose 4,6-dehydratase
MSKKAIIFGINGQDGSFLKELLIAKGYSVVGITKENGNYLSKILMDTQADEIYNFAGVSNVFSPYENQEEIFTTNALLPHKIMQKIVKWSPHSRFFQASSSLIFGRDNSLYQRESTPFSPIYPYGVAKLYAHNMVNEFRETYGIAAWCGIFYPHESERRGERFFSRKITKAAATKSKVTVGDLSAERDWGYAKDYVEAAWMVLQDQHHTPKDYVIGTGIATTLQEFAAKAFEYAGLDYRDYVTVDPALARKNDTTTLLADASLIRTEIGWKPKANIDELIKIMVDHDRTV